MDTTASPWWGYGTLVAAVLVAIAACGQTTGGPSVGTTTSGTGVEQGQVEVVAVHEDVDYFIGCMDVTLELDGKTYYPLLSDEREDLDLVRYGFGMGQFAALAPPQPGDDTGTVTIFADGMVHFVSDNGDEMWLSEEQREYNWVC